MNKKFEEATEKTAKRITSAMKTGKIAVGKVYRWVIDNKEDVAVLSGMAYGALKLIKEVKPAPTKHERAFKERQLYYYDRRTDMYYYLKREMTASEKIELSERMIRGESAGNILRRMRLLKY